MSAAAPHRLRAALATACVLAAASVAPVAVGACTGPAATASLATEPSAPALSNGAPSPPRAPASSGPASEAAAPKPTDAPPATAARPPAPPVVLRPGGKRAVRGEAGLVTSVEPNATRIGAEVLRKGGNAIDAAVAVAYALAVTHPSAGNIGGGGFMIVRLASGETHAVDFRETAPALATPEKNKAMLDAGAFGYASAPVPGSVAGLNLALERWGTRPLAELIAPAIRLARSGHRLGARQALVLSWSWDKLAKEPSSRVVYGRGDRPLREGERFRQPELARTLEAIAKRGNAGFYEGWVAETIDRAMRAHGGLVRASDLRAYRAKIRTPLRFEYRGLTIDTMPPPSMGGIALAEIMLVLERARAYEAPVDSGLALHLFVEASRRAYAQRRLVGADPDFMPERTASPLLARLLDADYLEQRRPLIDPERATPSSQLPFGIDIGPIESPQTTHFSVVDAEGNAVACTMTQSAAFGSKVVIPGTGVLLSNAMGGFSETGPNALAPGKRMASSMTPTIVSRNGKLVMVLGSPGGDTIPNVVAQVLRNLADWGMTIDEAVEHGRVHHQWLPDRVRVEKLNPPPKDALDDLARRGHTVHLDPMPIGDANDILVDEATGVAWGYADRREGGMAEGISRSELRPRGARPAKRASH